MPDLIVIVTALNASLKHGSVTETTGNDASIKLTTGYSNILCAYVTSGAYFVNVSYYQGGDMYAIVYNFDGSKASRVNVTVDFVYLDR